MSSFDRITGNYTLETLSGACGIGDIRLVANDGDGNIYIYGNLFVIGELANVKSTTTYVTDSYIRVSSEVEGVPILNAGLQVERGDECTVEIRWNEAIDRWEFTEDCTTYNKILGKVQDDITPVLGGDLKTSSFQGCFEIQSDYPCNIVLNPGIDYGTTRGAVEIKQIRDDEFPSYNSGSVTLYAKEPKRCGEIGLYVKSPTKDDQLITKRHAAVLSLVL